MKTRAQPGSAAGKPGHSLGAVGRISVPSLALKHPHVMEALALARVFANDDTRLERVIGTDNKQAELGCQLYGWGCNVAPHRDRTGFVFFVPLVVHQSAVCTNFGAVRLRRGTVYRLNDHVLHWTEDSAPVVCAFVGPFNFPHPAPAIEHLRHGIEALASGVPDAPRVRSGFRVLEEVQRRRHAALQPLEAA